MKLNHLVTVGGLAALTATATSSSFALPAMTLIGAALLSTGNTAQTLVTNESEKPRGAKGDMGVIDEYNDHFGTRRIIRDIEEFDIPKSRGELVGKRRRRQAESLGSKGEKGESGFVGSKGAVGERGARGGKGDVGQKGEQGEKGDMGDLGMPGQKGEQGEIGDMGGAGDVGQKGDKGPIGKKGAVGDKGATGEVNSNEECLAAGMGALAGVFSGFLGAAGFYLIQKLANYVCGERQVSPAPQQPINDQ